MPHAPLTALLLAAILAAPARADKSSEEAKEHFLKGRRAFDLALYDKAIAEYEIVYNLKSDPVLLFNIAQCHRLAGRPELAVLFYRNYLSLVPKSPKRKEILTEIDALEKQIDARPQQPEKIEPVPPPSDESASRRGRPLILAGTAFVAVGLLAGMGTGLGLGLNAAVKGDAITLASETHTPFDPALEADGRTLQLGSIVSYIAGGAIAVVGAVLIILGARAGAARTIAHGPALGWTF